MPSTHGALGSLLLTDARLPTGGFAHSAGLEAAVAAGLTLAEVPDYLAGRLRTVALVDAAAAVLAHRAALRDPGRLAAVHEALAARMPVGPLREASGSLGRGLLRFATRRWPDDDAVTALRAIGRTPLRPVALGVVAARLELSEDQTARAGLYDDAQTVASAALKLLPVDPVDAAGWLLDVHDVLEASVCAATAVTGPDDLPACAAPLVEQYGLDHHHTKRRIFVA